MRDSLTLRKLSSRGDRPTRQKTAEMKDRGRRSARGGSPSAPRKNSSEPVINHSSSRKRTRGSTRSHQKGAPTPRIFQDRSFQVSPSPRHRKRGRLHKEERIMASSTKTREKKRERKGRTRGSSSSTAQHGWVQQVTPSSGDVTLAPSRPSSSRMRESRPSSRRAAAGSAPDSSSVVRPGPSAVSETTAAYVAPAWPFLEQKPQRQTRQRPVDPDKLIKVCVERSDGGGDNMSSSNSSRGRNNSAQHNQAVQNPILDHGEKYLASSVVNASSSKASGGSGISSRPHSNGIANGTLTSSSRRHVVRSSSGVASRSGGTSERRTPPSSASNTTTTTPPSAQVSATTATGEGGARGEGRETEAAKTDNVICPQFRLHNLFDAGNTITTTADNDDTQSCQTSGKPTLGPRRKRPVKTEAGATREGRSMAPPRRSASACGGGGEKQVGFLDQTKDALVRSTQAVFGSDYDMDDDDFAFLQQLNGGKSTGGGSKVATGGDCTGEKGWAVSANLFEGMIERLERQESRARDTMVLVEASLRLKEEHADASKRVDQFIKEGDAVLNFAAGVTEDDDFSARRGRSGSNGVDGSGGGGAARDVSGGSNSDGHMSDAHGGGGSSSGLRHGCGSTSSTVGRRRKKHTGYVQEEDSDSDDGERHARIMRSRGPVTLTQTFALPLLRSYVTAFKSASDSRRGATNVGNGLAGARETASRRSKGWKGKGKQPASRSGRSSGGNEEEEEEENRAAVSDDQLLDVFRYWAKKREAYGGPMLRCFHPFIMKLWRRMEDPVREAEDQEEGKDPHASPEAFDTLKSFRQDLDKARLVVDCVKRREKLKRSAIRFANAYWKIFDDTMDAPRPRAPRPSQPKVTTASAAPPAAPPLLSTSARPSTRRAARTTSGAVSNGVNVYGGGASGAGGSRSSGRAAAAAARAAVAALATAESMEEGDYDAGVEEQERGGEGEREEEVPTPPPLPAKLNGKAEGLAEQEQGWNTFAQLPTRAVAIPTSVRPPRQKKKGPGVQRERNEVRERALQAVTNPARGLFVHRGVAVDDVAVDRRHERPNSTAVELVERDEGIPGAPQHQRSTNSSKPPGKVAPAVNAEQKIDERARRRERFNSASSAALAQQQASRRQQSNRQQSSTRQSSRQQPSRMHRLRGPQSEVVQADEEQDESAEVQDVEAPIAAGRASRRGGAGLRDGVAGRRGVGGANEPEKVNEARSNTTKKRRKAAFGPEDAEEESNKFDGATKGRKVMARGSERTKRRRLDENTSVDNGALSNVRQHRARSSSASSSSSSDHPSISNTRASQSETAVVVMEDVPISPKAAVMLPKSKNHKTTSRPSRRKSRFANDGRRNRALARLS
ncbi:unnamed protein product [Ectocarpus sp. CCAP 1310/34]|nr:unnamed protein product [Ectocarpus sp. CCAP 1310/34]